MSEPALRALPAPASCASFYRDALADHCAVFARLAGLDVRVEQAAHTISRALRAGGKVMLCGNGGSAADCQHIAAELTGRFEHDRPPMAGLALSTDTSALTCIGNDYGFADVFARQVQALGRRGDCLVAISTSGRSENVVRAVRAARALGVVTIALTGGRGGPLAALCDQAICVPSDATARIQEAHIFIGHSLCKLIEANAASRTGTPAANSPSEAPL